MPRDSFHNNKPAFRLDRRAPDLLAALSAEDISQVKRQGCEVVKTRHSVGIIAMHETRRVLHEYYADDRPHHLSVLQIATIIRGKERGAVLTLPVKGIHPKPYADQQRTKISLILDDCDGLLAADREKYLQGLRKTTGVSLEFDEFTPDIKLGEVVGNQSAVDAVVGVFEASLSAPVKILGTTPFGVIEPASMCLQPPRN